MGHYVGDDVFSTQSRNLLWPQDLAWCVATEIDLDSPCVGGSAALVRDLLDDARVAALPVRPTDPIGADSDDLNR